MTVFVSALKRLMRNKFNIFTIFLLTPLFIGVTFGLGSFERVDVTIGLVDLDGTALTERLAQEIADSARLRLLSEGSVRGALTRDQVDYILVVDPGFSQELIKGGSPKLRSYSIKESNVASRIILKVQSFVGAAQGIAETVNGDEEAFYQGLDSYLDGSFSLEAQVLEARGGGDFTLRSLGLLAFSMMTLSSFSVNNLLKEREDRTFYRVMSSPLTLKRYMLQNILGYCLILLWQVLTMFLALKWVFGADLGPSFFSLFLVMGVFALYCVSFGVALAAIARTSRQAGAIAPMIITPMSMLSGLYWPRSIMPRFLEIIGRYLPPTWLIEAAEKVLQGEPLKAAGLELTILLGFTLVLFLLGTWRRADVAR